MSWSISTTLFHEHTEEGIKRDREVLDSVLLSDMNQQAEVERDAQVQMAKDAVIGILSNSSTFDNAEEISVSMSGHANVGNLTSKEYANDYVQISLSVRKYRQVVS